MGELRLGQGREAAKQYFAEHPEEAEELHQKLIEAMQTANEEAHAKQSKLPRPAAPDIDKIPATTAKPVNSRALSVDADDFGDDMDGDLDADIDG